MIGWCAGLAIGMTIGVSQNNIMLGIGLGVAFGASLGHVQIKKKVFKQGRLDPRLLLVIKKFDLKKWYSYPFLALINAGGLATITFFIIKFILDMSNEIILSIG